MGSSPRCWASACMRMFSMSATTSSPYFRLSVRAAAGMSVWTWTLKISSSSLMTRLSPIESRYSRSGRRSISKLVFFTM